MSRILMVNYRYFISGGPERYMFNIKNIFEQKGHKVIPFSVRNAKNVDTAYKKYFVKPIGGENTAYFNEYKKSPKTVLSLLSRSFYSLEVKKAMEREMAFEKPDVVYILHLSLIHI